MASSSSASQIGPKCLQIGRSPAGSQECAFQELGRNRRGLDKERTMRWSARPDRVRGRHRSCPAAAPPPAGSRLDPSAVDRRAASSPRLLMPSCKPADRPILETSRRALPPGQLCAYIVATSSVLRRGIPSQSGNRRSVRRLPNRRSRVRDPSSASPLESAARAASDCVPRRRAAVARLSTCQRRCRLTRSRRLAVSGTSTGGGPRRLR
jgi:hypothetical protein